MKRLLYLSDLYNYYVTQNKNVTFSSKDNDTTIVVHIDEPFTYDKKSEDNDLNLITPIRLCHTEKNVNQSYISERSMKNAISSAYNIPILGYIYKDSESGDYVFAGHEFFVNEDKEIEYEEVPVGCIPESAGLELVYDKDSDKTYLDGNGIIWRTYSRAAEILEREKRLSCSVELVVDELSYDSKEKVLVIDKFRFSGVTILQQDRETGKEIKPGMSGANISIEDFSEKNNSVFSQNDKVIELLSELNEKLDGLNIYNEISGKEDTPLKKEFEENLEAEVEDTPTEVFEETLKKKKDEDDTVIVEKDEDDDDDKAPEVEETPEEPVESEVTEEESVEDTESEEVDNNEDSDDDSADDTESYYSVTVSHGDVRQDYSLSLQDKIQALYALVNDTFAEADGTPYDVTVYEEDKYVIMNSWFTNSAYRQSYKVKKDIYSLVGDRIPVRAVWCTDDEEKALENMRANYSSIEEKLAQYESEPAKLDVINSEEYAQIKDTEAFKKLSERDTYFSMTVDEVRAEADKQLLEFAKHNKIEFSSNEDGEKKVGVKFFSNPTKKASKGNARYGGIFSK